MMHFNKSTTNGKVAAQQMNGMPLGLSPSESQAKEHSSPFRALVLIGVAAAFCAAFIPNTTKPCVASKLAEADHAVVSPPQWLPVLLASSSDDRRLLTVAVCVPHWVSGDVTSFWATASMMPAIVTLDGVQIGHPVETEWFQDVLGSMTSCDEIAALGVDDGIVRGVSVRINQGFSVPIIGNGGELIEFRYWNANQGKEYFSEYRYTMRNHGQIGSFVAGGEFELVLRETPFCDTCGSGCNKVELLFGGAVYPVDVGGTGCVVRGTTCVDPSRVDQGYALPSGEDSVCVRGVDPAFAEDYLVPCYTPCVDAPPPPPPPARRRRRLRRRHPARRRRRHRRRRRRRRRRRHRRRHHPASRWSPTRGSPPAFRTG